MKATKENLAKFDYRPETNDYKRKGQYNYWVLMDSCKICGDVYLTPKSIMSDICDRNCYVVPDDVIEKQAAPRRLSIEYIKKKAKETVVERITTTFVGAEYKLLSTEYKNNSTKMKWLHTVCNETIDISWSNFESGYGCIHCANKIKSESKIKYTIEEITKIANELIYGNHIGSEYILLSTEYKGYDEKLEWFHIPCKQKKLISWHDFKYGRGCYECGKKRVGILLRNDSEEVYENMRSEDIEPLSEYKGGHEYMKVKCNKCDWVWSTFTYASFATSGNGCPKCNQSKGAKKITKFLDKHNIYYDMEKRFDDCRNERALPFDFYIPSFNLLIEYDGEQHERPVDFFGGEESFKITQKHDAIKNRYCKKQGIDLIRISHTEFDNIEEILKTKIFT